MLAEIVIGIIFALLLLFILGGIMAIHENIESHHKRVQTVQSLTLKLLIGVVEEYTNIALEEIEGVAQCPHCFDAGGLCKKHEEQARNLIKKIEG